MNGNFRDVVEQGYIENLGQDRYTLPREGVDRLVAQTESLADFTEYVERKIIETVDTETVVARGAIEPGDRVSLSLERGVLRATPGEGSASAGAVEVTAAEAGQDVGVTDFEGLLEYDLGSVTVLSMPPVVDGGSRVVTTDAITDFVEDKIIVAVAETEALATARREGLAIDVRFGTVAAIEEAAKKGADVLLLAVESAVSNHTDRLRGAGISYEVKDATGG